MAPLGLRNFFPAPLGQKHPTVLFIKYKQPPTCVGSLMISLLYSGVCESDTYSLKPLLGILNFDLFPARDAQ